MWENKLTVYLNYKFTSKFLLLVFLRYLTLIFFKKYNKKKYYEEFNNKTITKNRKKEKEDGCTSGNN